MVALKVRHRGRSGMEESLGVPNLHQTLNFALATRGRKNATSTFLALQTRDVEVDHQRCRLSNSSSNASLLREILLFLTSIWPTKGIARMVQLHRSLRSHDGSWAAGFTALSSVSSLFTSLSLLFSVISCTTIHKGLLSSFGPPLTV